MTKKKYGNGLFIRISLSFVIMLIIIGFAYVISTTLVTQNYFKETTQRLNADVANYLLNETPPFKNGEVNKEALDVIMHSMMAVNPGIEVYLLDTEGEILSYVVLKKKVKLSRVSIEPILQFIETKGEKYITGDHPRDPDIETIFSATEVIEEGNSLGYIYIVLASEKYQNIASLLSGSYWLKLGVRTFSIALVAAILLGLFLIWLLTRNLRIIIRTVNQFKEGDLEARIEGITNKGDLSVLADTYNSMADTILKNIDDLKTVDELRRELVANVSHDLRSPLAVIQGYIETIIMKSDTISKEEREEYLNIVLDSSNRLNNLVNDLFELSKLEAGQIELKKEPFHISDLLNDAQKKYSLLLKQKNINLNLQFEETVPMVYADLVLMNRVIQNLIDNAYKYTPNSGEINIKVQEIDEAIQINIENTGVGIPDKDIPYIFNRYYKVDKKEKGIDGTGLGLAIVKKIVDCHNAEITVSRQQEKYTRFQLNLPAYSA
jgi:signal transduction histidine kinase